MNAVERCWWAGDDALYVDYHDREWGFPVDDDRPLDMKELCHGSEKCPLQVPLHPGAAKYYTENGYL